MPLSSRTSSDAEACNACLAGMHSMCNDGTYGDDRPCCCGGKADLDTLFKHLDVEEVALLKELREAYGVGASDGADGLPAATGFGAVESKPKGDPGYIHPDAWPSTRDIGTLTAVGTTGRKRQAKMYPIPKGKVCDWAGKLVTLDDLPAIVGCLNSPATDLHHGPDKNTLNNESASRGVGLVENTHMLCSDCHNSLHARHDPFYETYDRDAQQVEPWMPKGIAYGHQYRIEDAPEEMLFEEEAKRRGDRKRRGKVTRGRQARTPEEGDFSVADEG